MHHFRRTAFIFSFLACAIFGGWPFPCVQPVLAGQMYWQKQSVTFLGTTLDPDGEPTGIVAELDISFRKQEGQEALNVTFSSGPGKFSPYTQVAIQSGIVSAARMAGLDPKAWNIFLKFPTPGVTIYGDSLTAMVSVVALAMANDNPIILNRVMTGKVTQDGHIGAVGGIPLKIQAAFKKHIPRVIIPDDRFPEDNDWQTPFLMQISPVNTVLQAYQMLTGATLSGAGIAPGLMVQHSNEK